jgi:hypothetical protein
MRQGTCPRLESPFFFPNPESRIPSPGYWHLSCAVPAFSAPAVGPFRYGSGFDGPSQRVSVRSASPESRVPSPCRRFSTSPEPRFSLFFASHQVILYQMLILLSRKIVPTPENVCFYPGAAIHLADQRSRHGVLNLSRREDGPSLIAGLPAGIAARVRKERPRTQGPGSALPLLRAGAAAGRRWRPHASAQRTA